MNKYEAAKNTQSSMEDSKVKMSGTKLCPTCNVEKHVLEYGASTRTSDGLYYECRKCRNERNARNKRKKMGKKNPKLYDVNYPTKD